MQQIKIGLISLGCPRNLTDSEVMCALLTKEGFKICDDFADCDVAIINTCSFIEDAKKESIDVIFDAVNLKKQGRIQAILVCGCLPQRYKKLLVEQLPEIDGFLGTGNFSDICRAIKTVLKNDKVSCINSPGFLYDYKKTDPKVKLTTPHYAYIKIAEGCAHNCSYCIIPELRGRLRSRTPESIIQETKQLCEIADVKELNIVSQDSTLYGQDLYGRPKIAELLSKIANLNIISWIRLLYAHPAHFGDDLIRTISDTPSVCKYIDLPIEHINDEILKRMNRKTTKKQIISLIDKLRKLIKGLTIRTTFIVGFPGETEAQFKELIDFIKDFKFERMGAFIYSREEGTAAYKYKNQLPHKVKASRFDELMKVQQQIATEINSRHLGRIMRVLVDEKDKNQKEVFLARTEGDAPEVDGIVYVESKKAVVGEFLDVKITDTLEYDLVGQDIRDESSK